MTLKKTPSRITALSIALLMALCFVTSFSAQVNAYERSMEPIKINMPFLENQGQADDCVKFYSPTQSGTVFVTDEGEIFYSIRDQEFDTTRTGWCLRESLKGADIGSIEGSDPVDTAISFLKGKNPEKWRTRVPAYGAVFMNDVYEGIDLGLHAFSREVEKRFYVRPGADPANIRIRMQGAESLKVNTNGELEALTERGTIRFTRPIAWQEAPEGRRPIEVAYRVEEDGYAFTLMDYDPSLSLVIDPMLASTFHGGLGAEFGFDTLLGTNDDIYVGGYTASDPFPVTPGALEEDYSGGAYDAFVARFDKDLGSLLACTYLGGSGDEGWFYLGLALDASGAIFVTGNTSTNDFPIITGAFDDSYNGGPASGPYGTGGDQFISKLSGDLSTLIASTYLGGGGYEYCRGILLDDQGNVYVAGCTSSTDFPVSPGAYDELASASNDAYVACLDNTLSTRIAATYLGGGKQEFVEAIRRDGDGNIFVTGWTQSTNFPTPGGYYPDYGGGMYDAFVSKFTSDLTALPASSYIGGTQWDFGYCMDLDADGNVFIAGHAGKNFPTSTGAYCETYQGTLGQNYGDDVFVAKFDNSLGNVLMATYLGGERWENATCMRVDEEGCVYLAGTTSSTEYPTLPGAYDRVYNGGTKYEGDFFITRMNNGLTEVLASTYVGGTSADGGYATTILLEPGGELYLAGETASSDFPMVPGAEDPDYNGGSNDVILFKIDRELTANPSLDADGDSLSATSGGTINLTLDPGADFEDRTYLILGTTSGTSPGFVLPGGLMDMPINWDVFTDICLMWLNTSVFYNFYGSLDTNGTASAQISTGPIGGGIGTIMHYAFALNGPFDFASNAISIEILP